MEKKTLKRRDIYLAYDVLEWINTQPYPNEESMESYSSKLRHLLGIPKEVVPEPRKAYNRRYNVQDLAIGESRLLAWAEPVVGVKFTDQTPIHNAVTRHMRTTGQVLKRTCFQHGVRITRTK